MSPGSASNSIVEPDRLWRYDWPQIQWMIGLWFCRDRAIASIADSRSSCSLQWTIYSNNTADLHARNPFPWRGTSFHQLIELNFRLDCAIKLIFSVFTWFAFFLVFLPQQVWSRSCAIIPMVYMYIEFDCSIGHYKIGSIWGPQMFWSSKLSALLGYRWQNVFPFPLDFRLENSEVEIMLMGKLTNLVTLAIINRPSYALKTVWLVSFLIKIKNNYISRIYFKALK